MVILVPSEEVIPLEISVEDALKYVVFAGFLLPEKPSKAFSALQQNPTPPA